MTNTSLQHYAAHIQALTTHCPSWSQGALTPFAMWQCIKPLWQNPLPKPHTQTGYSTAMSMTLFAWQNAPLHHRFLQVLAAHMPQIPLYTTLASWCQLPLAAHEQNLRHEAQSIQHTAATEKESILALAQKHLSHPHYGGFFLEHLCTWCLRHDSDGSLLTALTHLAKKHVPADIKAHIHSICQYYLTSWNVLYTAPHMALEHISAFEKIGQEHFNTWIMLRKAKCLQELGQIQEAIDLMTTVWHSCPWHTNVILYLHDLVFPHTKQKPSTYPPIALYSWNKAEILEQSLISLAQTEARDAQIYVLNNGSTDTTKAMLTAAQKTWPTKGGDNIHIITLPVNIGAPAARNWLLMHQDIREQGQVIFLDDDVLLDSGWLDSLCTTALAYPRAAVVGCAIESHLAPHSIQSTDFFLQPKNMGQRSFADLEEHIFLSCQGMGTQEHQLTRYTRPCLSVSGCCHLLRFDQKVSPTLFDIRFNPSQFDDVERDMRLQLTTAQKFSDIIYTGHVRIKHVQHSSLAQAKSRASNAHIFGNKIKFEHLFSARDIETLHNKSHLQAQQDLMKKITKLATHLPHPAHIHEE